jgi:hypothetical protein
LGITTSLDHRAKDSNTLQMIDKGLVNLLRFGNDGSTSIWLLWARYGQYLLWREPAEAVISDTTLPTFPLKNLNWGYSLDTGHRTDLVDFLLSRGS